MIVPPTQGKGAGIWVILERHLEIHRRTFPSTLVVARRQIEALLVSGLTLQLAGALLLAVALAPILAPLPVKLAGIGTIAFGQLLLCVAIVRVIRVPPRKGNP